MDSNMISQMLNPVSVTIEKMFSNELSGSKWKTLKSTDVVFLYHKYADEVITEYEKRHKLSPPMRALNARIIKKLEKTFSVIDQITYLSERMLG